jgi:hypothetical protein
MKAEREIPWRSSIDDIIEIYKRDVDVTLIDAALQRSVEARIAALEEFEQLREELASGMSRERDAIR